MHRTIALTGGIASGKSEVSAMLASLGAYIIDSDALAREVVEPGTPGLAAVVERFGPEVLDADGSLDRARLAAVVFADAGARADLNAIVHPAVRRRAGEWLLKAPPGSIVIHVIPLLVETGLVEDFDIVIVVDVDPEVQVARLMARNGLSRPDALARLAAQASREERLAWADVVIDNSTSLEALRTQVEALWFALRQGTIRGPGA